MKLCLLTSLIWITAPIATPVSVIPSAIAEQKDEGKESTVRYDPPAETRPYFISFEAEIHGARDERVEDSSSQKETDGARRRELAEQEFYATQVNGSAVVKESSGTSGGSLPEEDVLLPEEELPSSRENAESFGKKIMRSAQGRNSENSQTCNTTAPEGEKSGNESQGGFVFMNFEGTFLNESDRAKAGNVSTSPAARSESESSAKATENSDRGGDYYDDDQGEESVLSEIIKSYEEIRTPFEEVNSRAANGTLFEYGEKRERKEKLQRGLFSRPIVVVEENHGNDSNRRGIVFGDKSSTLPKGISMAESNNRKGIISSSAILNPLQVGIALMNQIPEDQKNTEKPRGEDGPKYSDNPIEESKEELLLSDEPKANKIAEEPPRKVGGSVEIQKSVELYHNAPIQEIHYPVEYTSHIYTVPQTDQTRSNLLRNEIEKSLDEQRAETRLVPDEEGLGFQYSLNRPAAPEETRLSIVPQPTIYLQSIQEQQNSLQDYGERKRLTQVVVPEEYTNGANESGKLSNENSGNRSQQEYTLYQFPNLGIFVNEPKKNADAGEERNSVRQYVVEYQKSLEPQEYVSQQVFNYQPLETQQVVYGTLESQRNVYQPVDNRENVYQSPENSQNTYQATSNQQNVYQPPENSQNIYQSTDSQENIYQQSANPQIVYQSTDNQQNVYQPAENQQNVYQSNNNQQNVYQTPENQQSVYQAVSNQQNVYPLAENKENIYQAAGNPAIIYSPVKHNPERIRENLAPPQSENQNPSFERYPIEKYVHKAAAQVPYQDSSYPIRQGGGVPPRPEIIEHPFAIPLRLNPLIHKHVILPVSQILPYSLQRFMVQPPVVPVRPPQPHYANKIEVGGAREPTRPKPRRPQPGAEGEKSPKYKSPATKIPERTPSLPNPLLRHPPRQNVSNVLQLYDYVYDAPLFALGRERGAKREQLPKKAVASMQFAADEEHRQAAVPRFTFSARPAAPQLALNFHAGSRKRQAMYNGPAKNNRSSKDEAAGAAFLRQSPGMKVTRQQAGRNSIGTFRQSKMEYGFKPPMVPSVQYDEETATKVDS